MVTAHQLPRAAFIALAQGAGDSDSMSYLRDVQRSKHMMLLHAIDQAVSRRDHRAVAFRAGYKLFEELQATDAGTWLLGLPHLGGWAHDCLTDIEDRRVADLGHFASLAAAAAIRAGIAFEFDVPLRRDVPGRRGCIALPGLGSIEVPGRRAWIRLRCDGDLVTAGQDFAADRHLLIPDSGAGQPVPSWSGTPSIQITEGGLTWTVLLETEDRHLDRYQTPFYRPSAEELRAWRHRTRLAWRTLVRNHRWAAEPMAGTISVIVPLASGSETDLVSATSPAAFGAIATSWPPDHVALAETLVHEFQHVKLAALIDMVPLVKPCKTLVYAPWRDDPRPVNAILQGVYAHLGIVRFWRVQREFEKDPDGILRAQGQYARWRPTIEPALDTMMEAGCLTPEGRRFVRLLSAQGESLTSVAVPSAAREIAEEAALDHRLTWQLKHVTVDPASAARLAAAYQRGEPSPGRKRPRGQIEEDVRKVDANTRSRLLTLRYLAPARYRELRQDQQRLPSPADRLLLEGQTAEAIQAYRDQIVNSATPEPAAWIGLALALHRLPSSPLKHVFTTQLALIFDVHGHLEFQGGQRDPINLAEWLL